MNITAESAAPLLFVTSNFRTQKMTTQPHWKYFEEVVVPTFHREQAQRAQKTISRLTTWKNTKTEDAMLINFATHAKDMREYRLRHSTAENAFRDVGLDALCIYEDGSFDVIQAKYHNGNINGNHTGSFAWMLHKIKSKHPNFGVYLYVSEQSTVSAYIENLFKMHENWHIVVLPCTIPEQSLLKVEDVQYDEVKYTLRPKQQEAVAQLNTMAKNIILLNYPCGTGKTVIIGSYIKDKTYDLILCIAPLIASTEQLIDRLSKFVPNYAISKFWSKSGASTDVNQLKKILDENQQVMVGTTFASSKIVKAIIEQYQEECKEDPNILVVIDEAHNLYMEDEDLWAMANNYFKGTVILATATPSHHLEENLGEINYQTISYSLKDAIANKEVCDMRIVLPDLHDIHHHPIEVAVLEHKDGFQSVARALFHLGNMLHDGLSKSICFFNSKKHIEWFHQGCQEVAKYLNADLWFGQITEETSRQERKKILHEFDQGQKNVLHVLCSVRILAEAIDIPCCDSVFIGDVTDSEKERASIRTIQCACRANRKDPKNPDKIAVISFWCDDDFIPECLLRLGSVLPDVEKKVRYRSIDFDRAVGDKEIEAREQVLLTKFVENYQVKARNWENKTPMQWLYFIAEKMEGKVPSSILYLRQLKQNRDNVSIEAKRQVAWYNRLLRTKKLILENHAQELEEFVKKYTNYKALFFPSTKIDKVFERFEQLEKEYPQQWPKCIYKSVADLTDTEKKGNTDYKWMVDHVKYLNSFPQLRDKFFEQHSRIKNFCLNLRPKKPKRKGSLLENVTDIAKKYNGKIPVKRNADKKSNADYAYLSQNKQKVQNKSDAFKQLFDSYPKYAKFLMSPIIKKQSKSQQSNQ